MQTHLFSLFATIFAASFATNAPVFQRRDDQQVLGPGTLGWRSITTIGTSTSCRHISVFGEASRLTLLR